MAAVSYLQNIDTRPVEYKPYKLPYQAFMQEYAANNQYLAQSAAIIQSAYKNVLDIDPLFAKNKDYVKNFLTQAEKNLSKIVKSDMLITDNAVNAASVFKPIFDTSKEENRLLLTDSELNKHYKEQTLKANQARENGGGKTWNANNEFYFQDQYQKYKEAAKNGADIKVLDDLYNKKKSFIPYYDILPDLKKVKELCHSSSKKTTSISESNYLYYDNNSSSGISQEQMASCVGFLPDAAKQQIGINSYAKYINDKEGLMGTYKSFFVDDNKKKLDFINAQHAVASLYKGDDKVKLADIAALTNLKSEYQTKYDNGLQEWNKMLGDKSEKDYIDQNYERIASDVGNVNFAARAAQAMSWADVENKLSSNASGIVEFNAKVGFKKMDIEFQQQRQLNNDKFLNESALKDQQAKLDIATGRFASKAGAKGKKGTGTEDEGDEFGDYVDSGLTPRSPDATKEQFDIKVNESFDFLGASLKGIGNAISSAFDASDKLSEKEKVALKKILYDPNLIKNPANITYMLDAYDKLELKDPMIDASIASFNQARRSHSRLMNQRAAIEESIQVVSKLYPVEMADGKTVNFSTQEVVNLSTGQTVKGYNKNQIGSKLQFNQAINGASYDLSATKKNTETAYKTQWTNSSQWKYLRLNKTDIDARDANLKNNFGIGQQYDVTRYFNNEEGDVIFQLEETTKDDNGVKTSKAVTEEDMRKMNLTGVGFEEFGGYEETPGSGKSKAKKDLFFKVKNYAKDLPIVNVEMSDDLRTYTDLNYKHLELGQFVKEDNYVEIEGPNGAEYRITIGKIAAKTQGNSRPVFRMKMKVGSEWKVNNTLFNSIDQVVSTIEANN